MCKPDTSLCVHHQHAQLEYGDLIDPTPETIQLLWAIFPRLSPPYTDYQIGIRHHLNFLLHIDPHTSPTPHTFGNIMSVWRGRTSLRQTQILLLFHVYAESHKYFKFPKGPKKCKGGKGYGILKAVERATRLKEEGNEAFRICKFHSAFHRYVEALKALCPYSVDLTIMRSDQLRQSGIVQLEFALVCNLARSLIKIASSDIPLSDNIVEATRELLHLMMDNPAATKSEISRITQIHLALLKAYPKHSSYDLRQYTTMIAKANDTIKVGDDEWIYKTCCNRLHELEQEDLD